MDLYLSHFILLYLGCINLVRANPLETLYLDVDIRFIQSEASGKGSTKTGYTFEGSESVDVLSTAMLGGVISSEPVDESTLFFTYNHDKLLLQSYKVDNCTYYKLSPHVPGTIKTIFRGIFMVWESKGQEEFVYMVFTEPLKDELMIHLFVKRGTCFKRYVYNTNTKIFYYVRSSKTIYTMLPSKTSEECRAEARAVTHSKLVPRSEPPQNPEKTKLILKIPEAVRERARRREKELLEKGLLRYPSKSKESETSSKGTGKEKDTGDQQAETSTSYQMPQESRKYKRSDPEPSTSSGVDKERSEESVYRPTPSWRDEPVEFMHDPVLIEVIERHNRYKAKYQQFLTRKEKLRKESRKGVPKKLEVTQIPAGSDNDDDTSGEGKLVIDEDSQTQTQEEKSDKDEKKEESKRKGKAKRKSQGQGHKKPDDDDKPEGGSGQGGAAAGGSGRSQSSGYNLRSTSGTGSRTRESTGDGSSDKSGESSREKEKQERMEDEGRQGRQHSRGALITQASLSDLNRPRIIGKGGTVNLEDVLRAYGNRQFAAMYHSDSEYLNYPVDPHLLRNYPKTPNLEDDEDDVDCQLQISDDDDPNSPSRQEHLGKEDRRVPDQAQEAIEKVTESTESAVLEPPREPRPYEQTMSRSEYTGDPSVVIRAIERFIRPEWDQPGTSGTYSRGQGATSTYSYSVTQQTVHTGEVSQVIPESQQFYQIQQPYQPYQSSQFFHTGEAHPSYLDQQSYQTPQEQPIPETQEASGSHILCIRGPKSKHPLVFPSTDTAYEDAENLTGSDFRLHLDTSTESSPCKRPLMSYPTETQDLEHFNVSAVPTQSNQNESAQEPALGAVAAPMGIYSQGVVPNDVPYEYQAPCFSPVSSEEGCASRPETEYATPSAEVEPPQEPGPSSPPTEQPEGGAAAAEPETKGDKVKKKKKKHVRKTRVVRKTIYPQSFLSYYLAANTHGYMECEDMIPSLPILPLMPEPQDVVESYTETETDTDDEANQGRDAEDTDSADEARSAEHVSRIRNPASPRPSRSRSSRRRQPEPPIQDDIACTIS